MKLVVKIQNADLSPSDSGKEPHRVVRSLQHPVIRACGYYLKVWLWPQILTPLFATVRPQANSLISVNGDNLHGFSED